jgi:hypothetical protein
VRTRDLKNQRLKHYFLSAKRLTYYYLDNLVANQTTKEDRITENNMQI